MLVTIKQVLLSVTVFFILTISVTCTRTMVININQAKVSQNNTVDDKKKKEERKGMLE